MISLYDSDIVKILPETLADKAEVKALGYAIQKAQQRVLNYCQNISVYAVIDSAPDKILDMLAQELNTQYYDDSLDIEAKRRLIKNTLVWYMSAGTPAAVEELVEAVFGEGRVVEWFEYGGAPYTFRIQANAPLATDTNDFFFMMIEKVKNTRSSLELIEIIRKNSLGLHVNSAWNTYTKNRIECGEWSIEDIVGLFKTVMYTGTEYTSYNKNVIT